MTLIQRLMQVWVHLNILKKSKDAYNCFWVFFVQNLLRLVWRELEHGGNHFGHRLWRRRRRKKGGIFLNEPLIITFLSQITFKAEVICHFCLWHHHPVKSSLFWDNWSPRRRKKKSSKKKENYLHNQLQAYLPGSMHFPINTGANQKQGSCAV